MLNRVYSVAWYIQLCLVFAHIFESSHVYGQTDYGNRLGTRGHFGQVYSAAGTSVLIETLDPTVQRWYLPQELFTEYGRRQWQYTNYAKDYYRRYVDRGQEGYYFYDPYGDLITRGWLIYDWRPVSYTHLTLPTIYSV